MSSGRSAYYNQVIAGSEGIWFYEEDPSNYVDVSDDEYNVFDDDDYLLSYNDDYSDDSDDSDENTDGKIE